MSRINIQGIVDDIKSQINIYTPIVEAIANSVDSIISGGIQNGRVEVKIIRNSQVSLVHEVPPAIGIHIIDNGVGFNQKNRDAFDTFKTYNKKEIGGKGFGRFMFHKYFNRISVDSTFFDENGDIKRRAFTFGKRYDIIENEEISVPDSSNLKTIVRLDYIKDLTQIDKKLETIARKILEKILVYFIDDEFSCPLITVRDDLDDEFIVLNDYFKEDNDITLLGSHKMKISVNGTQNLTYDFKIKTFKAFFPGSRKSKISLTAHRREVADTSLHNYIPEFEDDFYEELPTGENGATTKKNFIIKLYVQGNYLDENVSLERETFNFPKDKPDALYPLSKKEIEARVAEYAKSIFDDDVSLRYDKKKARIRDYVNENAPWHKAYFNDIDLSNVPYNINDQDIEIELQKIKLKQEIETKQEIKELLDSNKKTDQEQLQKAYSKITEIGKSDLAHYVFNRKLVLDAFFNALKRNKDGKAELEKELHSLIFPMNADTTNVPYEEHNLWLLDERLVFSEYVASDRKIGKKSGALKEPDLVVFDKRRAFRSGDNNYSNPLTIFEFKRPKRDTYKQEDDPILQIGNYVEDIRAGRYEMPEGIEPIKVNENTPVYAYVVADITSKIRDFAKLHQLTISPDGEGYFGFHTGFKMYIEILSFKKVLDDARLRNKIFFKKLQIE